MNQSNTPGSGLPSHPNSLVDEAFAALRRGATVKAAALIDSAATMTPEDPRVDLIRSRICGARHDAPGMLAASERVLAAVPDHPESLFAKAHALYSMGRPEEAIATIDAIDSDGNPNLAHNLLGIRVKALSLDGDPPEIQRILDRLIAAEGPSPRLVLLQIDLQRRLGENDLATAACTDLLARPDLQAHDRMQAGFKLALLQDRAGEPSLAADAARAANELGARPFDRDAFRRNAAERLEFFTPERFADRLQSGPETDAGADRPVFIVGMPRSGTSLLEQIIAAHPEADGVGERPDPFLIDEDLADLFQTASPRWLEQAGPEVLARAADRYLRMLDIMGARGSRVTNKALGLDAMVGVLATMLPQAKFLWIRRSHPDNRLSIWMHQIQLPWAWRLEDIDLARQVHDEAHDHWSVTLPDRICSISYEGLIRDQAAETERILRFLDLPPSDRCLEFHRLKRAVMPPSAAQVRNPLNADAIGRADAYRSLIVPPTQPAE